MKRILVAGAGRIGSKIVELLGDDFEITVADMSDDALEPYLPLKHNTYPLKDSVEGVCRGMDAVISTLPGSANFYLAADAIRFGASYFDITEDVSTAAGIRRHFNESNQRHNYKGVIMTQCGLAPGFVSIAASHLAKQFQNVDSIHLRVGALPKNSTNKLGYNLTWSANGLLAQYTQVHEAVHEYQVLKVQPMASLESLRVNGVEYEAFNTAGGLGTLLDSYYAREINYKTIRYPGHHHLMHFLLSDLGFASNVQGLEKIFEEHIPSTQDDVVVILISVTGWDTGGRLHTLQYANHIPSSNWTAIQLTTASSVCAVVDLALEGKIKPGGIVHQENVSYTDFITNRFGKVFAI